ncbi:hypothetical protein D3C75_832740 [compost metagenome]
MVKAVATKSIIPLAMKDAWYPTPSYSTPPKVAPTVIASCITATIRPPPASASSGSILASQVNQPTGAQVAIKPQPPSSTAVGTTQEPVEITANAMTAMSSGIPVSTLNRCRPTSEPTIIVPTSPATPMISRSSDNVGTSTCVTVSRNGRR